MNQYLPDTVSPPGETLRDLLEEIGLSQAELATRMGRPKKTINEIMNGKAAITTETSLQLEMVLGVPADFWNAREQNYREFLAREEQAQELSRQYEWAKQFPLSRMSAHGMVPRVKDRSEQVRLLLRFLGVNAPEQWSELCSQDAVSFRRSAAFEADPNALGAWLRAGVLRSAKIETQDYDKRAFVGALREARGLTREEPQVFQPALQALFAEAGVAVVFVPQLPKSRVSGATRWLAPNKALVQLSLRYKTNDHLWFTLFHEAAHILLHGKRSIFLDTLSHEGTEEEEANRWAADFLVPPDRFTELQAWNVYSKAAIRNFAAAIGIAPGIIVGRLQHEGLLPRSHCNDLKVPLEWATAAAA